MNNWYGYLLHWSHILQAYIGRRTLLVIFLAMDVLLAAWIIRNIKNKEQNKSNK